MEVVAVILVVGALLYVYHTDQLKTKDLRIHARDEKIIDVTSELKSKFITHEKNFILAKDIA